MVLERMVRRSGRGVFLGKGGGSQDHGFNLLRRDFWFVENIVCVLLSVGVGRTFSLSLSPSIDSCHPIIDSAQMFLISIRIKNNKMRYKDVLRIPGTS